MNTAAQAGGGTAAGGTVLWLRLSPPRLAVSRGLWAGAWYLLAYQVVGWLLFGVVFAVITASGLLAVTLAGLPVLIAAAVCLVLWLLFNDILVATGRAHATVARALLRPPPDPLAEAREVLRRPGPLPPLVPVPPGHRAGAVPPGSP